MRRQTVRAQLTIALLLLLLLLLCRRPVLVLLQA
jgi:hypothetical protein